VPRPGAPNARSSKAGASDADGLNAGTSNEGSSNGDGPNRARAAAAAEFGPASPIPANGPPGPPDVGMFRLPVPVAPGPVTTVPAASGSGKLPAAGKLPAGGKLPPAGKLPGLEAAPGELRSAVPALADPVPADPVPMEPVPGELAAGKLAPGKPARLAAPPGAPVSVVSSSPAPVATFPAPGTLVRPSAPSLLSGLPRLQLPRLRLLPGSLLVADLPVVKLSVVKLPAGELLAGELAAGELAAVKPLVTELPGVELRPTESALAELWPAGPLPGLPAASGAPAASRPPPSPRPGSRNRPPERPASGAGGAGIGAGASTSSSSASSHGGLPLTTGRPTEVGRPGPTPGMVKALLTMGSSARGHSDTASLATPPFAGASLDDPSRADPGSWSPSPKFAGPLPTGSLLAGPRPIIAAGGSP
jgi:hypothetical protein